MFRSRKINKKKAVVKKQNDASSSDEEEPVVVRHKSSSSKKQKKTVVKSFSIGLIDDVDDEDDDVSETKDTQKHRKRKRSGRGGMGFGGASGSMTTTTSVIHDDDDDMPQAGAGHEENISSTEDNHATARKSSSQSLYSKDALEQLKQAQKSIPPKPKNKSKQRQDTQSNSSTQQQQQLNTSETSKSQLEDFIPLNGNKSSSKSQQLYEETTILSGDQALAFDEEDDEETTTTPSKSKSKLHMNVTEHDQEIPESADWEAEIARRAGVGSTTTTTTTSTTAGATPIPSLGKLRDQISSTKYHLQQQQNDLETSTMRRQAELAQTESDLKRHRQAVEDSGVALQEYQQLRQNLVLWVGALRDLQAKVDPIRETAQDLLLEELKAAHDEWVTIPDDVASILRDANLLEQALGRQPTFPSVQDMEMTVDEFGRDVPSKYLRQRTQRFMKRVKRDKQHAFLEVEQVNEFRERYFSLQGALRVALEELSEEYLSLTDLISEFSNWKSTHVDEYKQCYAALSLGDLASVLFEVKMLESSWLSNLFQDDDEDLDMKEIEDLFSWVSEFQDIESDLQDDEDGPSQRVLEKTLCPFLRTLIDSSAGSYCFVSNSKSQLLSKCMARVTELFRNKSHDALVQLQEAIQRTLENAFHSMCIPIAKRGVSVDASSDDEQLQYAFAHAKGEHVKFVQRLLVNILRDWAPLMSTSPDVSRFVGVLLDFCSNKFLFVLSSLDVSEATELFQPVWMELNSSNLKVFLNAPEFMLQAAPIRAAAMAYKLE